jgi:(p)ppGpp synthase/HD superfamily hydrolase
MEEMNLSPAFTRALVDAEHYHHDQKRNSTTIPYVSHVLGVCSLVLEAGGDESEAIAALLHDAPEDAGGQPVLDAIEANYGKKVARIVAGCTDALVAKGAEKPAWRPRKQNYLDHLVTAKKSTLLVSAADKLHNLRAIQSDYMQIGVAVFERFKTGGADKRSDVLWYYRSLYEIYVRDDVASDPRRSRLSTPLYGILLWLEEVSPAQTSSRT